MNKKNEMKGASDTNVKKDRTLLHHVPKSGGMRGFLGNVKGWYLDKKKEGQIEKANECKKEAEQLERNNAAARKKTFLAAELAELGEQDRLVVSMYLKAIKFYSKAGCLVDESECWLAMANIGFDVEANLLRAIECEKLEITSIVERLKKLQLCPETEAGGQERQKLVHALKLSYRFIGRETMHILKHYSTTAPGSINEEKRNEHYGQSATAYDEADMLGQVETLRSHSEDGRRILGEVMQRWAGSADKMEIEYKP